MESCKQYDKKLMYEICRGIIEGEIDQFDYNPESYIEALGWDKNKYPEIEDIKHGICFQTSDVEDLIKIVEQECKKGNAYYENTITIHENNAVNDFVVNYVSKKIKKAYPLRKKQSYF